jgi:type I restriction enzyme S subunit
MTLETFFKKFDTFADAPDAVVKMRELVLDLAATGRLLPHQTEWERRALKSLATKIGSGSTPAGGRDSYFSEGIPLIRSMNVHFRGFDATGLVFLSDEQAKQLSNVIVQPDDVLLNITGASIGRVTIAPSVMAGARVNQHVTIIRPRKELSPRFLSIFLASPSVQRMIDEIQVGATRQALTKAMIEQFEIPLPPLAEQKRIVAKVDELMALCDRLEAQQQERQTRHADLARASLARFAAAPTPANLHFLFHKSYPIPPADLRKSILTLAVQGKLVPQDSKDEPAEDFLSRLDLKSTVDLPDCAEEDNRLPPSWIRVRFEDIALVSGGVTLGRKLGEKKTVTLPYLRVANVKRGEIDLTTIKEVSIGENEIERYALCENDLLMTEGGDWDKVGRAAIWRSEIPVCLHQNHVFRARMRSIEILPFWFERYFNSPIGRSYFESASKQTTNLASINMRQVRSCPIPFPPLAEQRRIVAKVGQLMALVDALETQLAAFRATAKNLLEALVAELTSNCTVARANGASHPSLGHRPRRPLDKATKG